MADTKVKKTTKVVSKTPVKAVKKIVAVKTAPKTARTGKIEAGVKVATPTKTVRKKTGGIEVDVFGLTGKAVSKIGLPKEIFGAKVNDTLMAQAVRVYLANQRIGMASTKTRGEVAGTTKKVYKQKGTGRARHGAKKAHIFVGGGIAFGPKPRDFTLSMPKKMKRGALFSALTSKLGMKTLMVVDAKAALKTRDVAGMLKALSVTEKKKTNRIVLVTTREDAIVTRSSRNIPGVQVISAQNLSTYDVLNNKHLILAKNAVDALRALYIKE